MSLNRAIWTLNLRPHYPQASEDGKALVEQMRKQRVQLTPRPAAEPPQQEVSGEKFRTAEKGADHD